MLRITQELQAKMEICGVVVDTPDKDTLLLRGVPVNPQFYNKSRTNLLVKRARQFMPFLVAVDEDLQYQGQDASLARAFSAAPRPEGWRILRVALDGGKGFEGIVEDALAALGFENRAPVFAFGEASAQSRNAGSCDPADKGADSLIESMGVNLSARARMGRSEPSVGREDSINRVAACLMRWGQTRLPLIVSEPGVGKTNLLHGAARLLAERLPEFRLMLIDLSVAFAQTLFPCDRESVFARLLDEARTIPGMILALEHLELVASELAHGPAMLARALDSGARIIATAAPETAGEFPPALARRMEIIQLSEPTDAETMEILLVLREAIASHHGVEIDETLMRACVSLSAPLPGQFPAKAILLVDVAAARAALCGASAIGPDDIQIAAQLCHCMK